MKQRSVAIDFGLARIGVAVSDESHMIASPLPNIPGQKKLEQTVALVISTLRALEDERDCSIDVIVVGLPLLMSGKQGLMADEVHAFVAMLKERSEWKIVTWDERLTSVQADRSLREIGMNRKKRAKQVDSVSAVIILQNYMDSLCLPDY